jgi:hypothetical protein
LIEINTFCNCGKYFDNEKYIDIKINSGMEREREINEIIIIY